MNFDIFLHHSLHFYQFLAFLAIFQQPLITHQLSHPTHHVCCSALEQLLWHFEAGMSENLNGLKVKIQKFGASWHMELLSELKTKLRMQISKITVIYIHYSSTIILC